jgi:CHASE1-domain containing sensor protein
MLLDPELVTAVGAVFAALSVLLASITAMVTAFKTRKEVAQVHLLVNATASAQTNRINQLVSALEIAGITVPTQPDR